ncbi:MAG TPA: rhodanese-like domain-containing protein [Thermoanaerobaculia bacterium]|nr:rhodanese-like domain-containing protein [Thermoanaerobaculia bacterium]
MRRLRSLQGWAAVLGSLALAGCHYHPIAAIEKKIANRPRAPFRRVDPAIAEEIIRDSPNILILDLRQPSEFQSPTGHLLNARNYPLARLPYRLLDLSAYREDTFIVYCRGGDSCGEDGMRILVASGFEDAILIDGGIDKWIRKGYRTALSLSGAPPRSGPPQPPTEPTPPPPR